MKIRILYGLLCILLITMTILLLIDKEELLYVYTTDSVYSVYHTDQTESITIPLLTNNVNHYLFQQAFISSVSITNGDEQMYLEIKDIVYSKNAKVMNNTSYDMVEFVLRSPVESNNLTISITQASIKLTYDDGSSQSFEIGDFNYIFHENYDDLSIQNLSATYEEVEGYNTIGGVNLTLKNNTKYNVKIKDIRIISSEVNFNYGASIVMEPCLYTKTVSQCLVDDNYRFHLSYEKDKEYIIRSEHEESLYVPLQYTDTPFIHRFSIEVIYQYYNQERSYIIDDFPFMRTSIFYDGKEETYHEYIINPS